MTIGRPIKPIELDHEVKEHLQSITRSPRWKTGLKTLIFYALGVSYSILVESGTK